MGRRRKRKRLSHAALVFVSFLGLLFFVAAGVLLKNILQPPEKVVEKVIPRVAIILDDFGEIDSRPSGWFLIKDPLTVAVLPAREYSRQALSLAKRYGKEAILHLPMEPLDKKFATDKSMIKVEMNDKEIRAMMMKNLQSVPGVKGMNNHMGSFAAQDERVVKTILRMVKAQGLFFIDSRTSNKSLIEKMARKMGVKTFANSVFLDGETTEAEIRARFKKLIATAKRRGKAIGIGHITRLETIKVLRELMPFYRTQGIRFVYASKVVE